VKISNTAIMCLSVGKGGMEIDAMKTATLLKDVGNVYIICKSGSYIAETMEHEPIDGISVLEVSFNSKIAIGFIDVRLMWQLRKIIKKYDIKNLVFFGVSEIKTIYFSLIGKSTRFIVRHGTKKSKAKRDLVRRMLFSRVNRHVAISKFIARNVKKIYPVSDKSEITVIYPSLGLTIGRKSKSQSSVIRILHTGRLVDGKGYDSAIDACDILFEHGIGFEFTAVGDMSESDYARKIQDKVSKKNYSNRIKFTGHVADVTQYLKESDILLFPSKGEGFCNSFNEALAYGLVCLAYDNTVFPELKELGFYFHVAKDGDLASLSAELLKICKNLSDEVSRCEPNIKLAHKLYTPEAERNAYVQILT
jgi:glycosyltransferase involved in cell wall biosynthesis